MFGRRLWRTTRWGARSSWAATAPRPTGVFSARALVHVAALAIADGEVRDRWLSHPERRAILGAAGLREHLLGWGPVSDEHVFV